MKTTIGIKLMGSFFIIFLFLVIMSSVAVLSLASVRESADRIASYSGEIEQVAALQSTLTEIASITGVYLKAPSPIEKGLILDDISRFNEQLNSMKNFALLKENEEPLLQDVGSQYDELSRSLNGLLTDKVNTPGDSAGLTRNMSSSIIKINDSLKKYRAIDRAEIDLSVENAAKAQKRGEFILGALSVLSLAGSIVLGHFLNRNISRPVRELTKETRTIGGGNLDHHLEVKTGDEIETLAHSFNDMAGRLKKAYQELEGSYFGTLEALAAAIDARDTYTHDHSRRVTRYAWVLSARFPLSPDETETIRRACILHDLGKIGVSDHVLGKPGPLDQDEWEEIKKHPARGFSMLEKVAFLAAARTIILHHHERYDGRGYPEGLGGEGIPLGARILAVADAFDALTSRRVYRQAKTVDEAVGEITANAGTQFDPRVVEALVLSVDELRDIRAGAAPAGQPADAFQEPSGGAGGDDGGSSVPITRAGSQCTFPAPTISEPGRG